MVRFNCIRLGWTSGCEATVMVRVALGTEGGAARGRGGSSGDCVLLVKKCR